MKKLSFLALAAAGLMLGACSSDKDDVAPQATESAWNGVGEGYMAVHINLPVSPSSTPTRATNDNFDDGLANEYAVKDAALLLFGGSDEASATLQAAYDLGVGSGENFKATDADIDDDDNISTAYLAVQKIESVPTGDNLYAMVCLNYKNVMSIDATTHKPTIAETDATGYTVSQLQTLTFAGGDKFTTKSGNAYFFMTNAVFSTVSGSETVTSAGPTASNLFTLATVNKSNIKNTAAEAEAAPAATVFVERAVAKATLWYNDSKKFKDGEAGEATISSVKWAIDNKEPNSFVVRNPNVKTPSPSLAYFTDYMGYSTGACGAGSYYRFAGNQNSSTTTNIINPAETCYRTYWCVDPQYGNPSDEAASKAPTGMVRAADATGLVAAATTSDAAYNAPQYCNENTFNVANQDYRNTTRALIEVTLEGGDFYNLNGSETRLTLDAAVSNIFKAVLEDVNFLAALNVTGVVTSSATLSVGTATKDGGTGVITAKLTENGTADDAIVFKAKRNATTGQVEFDDIEVSGSSSSYFDLAKLKTELTSRMSDIKSQVNAAVKVNEFTGGKMYYAARFEHFANTAYEKSLGSGSFNWTTALSNGDLAPWNVWETTDVPGASGAYPGDNKEKNYLGRYGMVRNNWYDVEIDKFLKLGSPVIPSADVTTTDDNLEQYMAIRIGVLSWAKRTQTWSF